MQRNAMQACMYEIVWALQPLLQLFLPTILIALFGIRYDYRFYLNMYKVVSQVWNIVFTIHHEL